MLFWEYLTLNSIAYYLAGESVLTSQTLMADGVAPSEPVAIVGLACRFPGASDPSAFWHLLRGAPG
jgi:hypothetical protein